MALSYQKAIESKPSVNISRGPLGLNCRNLSTVDPKDYSGRYNYSLSINSDSNNLTYTNNYIDPTYNETKIIRIREAERAFRQFKFNYYSFKFDNNYPELSNYTLCKENPSILHAYHSAFYSRQLDTQNYRLLEASDFELCYEITSVTVTPILPTETVETTVTPSVTTVTPSATTVTLSTTTVTPSATTVTPSTTTVTPSATTVTPSATTVTPSTTTIPPIFTFPTCTLSTCPPSQILDNGSCSCVDPPICSSPETTCTPVTLPPNIEPTIYGYAFYLDTIRSVDIPNIGQIGATCARGHRCPWTLFRPTLIKSDLTTILANRNICLDNTGGNDGSQIPVPGFTDLTGFERSDTFTFTISSSADIHDASIRLDCQYSGCHDGVTFVVLVAQDSITNEYIVIFSSCLLPSEVKDIGIIDCPSDNYDYCDPPPTVTPPTIPPFITESTITTTATPTLPPDVGENCCFCSAEGGTFQIYTNPAIQAWEFGVLPCGVTEINGAGSMIINCNGTLYEVEWTPSGNLDSSNYEIYDATITPI